MSGRPVLSLPSCHRKTGLHLLTPQNPAITLGMIAVNGIEGNTSTISCFLIRSLLYSTE
ncbi:hypothetical protein EIP86_005949 [Pleurotus ostreatoroseus]|nr:hypothetical protein EIP86_005949 [Pleurotus ostreatoroseus]